MNSGQGSDHLFLNHGRQFWRFPRDSRRGCGTRDQLFKALLDIEFERGAIHGYDMAFFLFNENEVGNSGALVQGDVYKPSIDGVFLYLLIKDMGSVLSEAVEFGSEDLLKTTEADFVLSQKLRTLRKPYVLDHRASSGIVVPKI